MRTLTGVEAENRARNLRHAMARRHLTTTEVAEHVGYESPSSINKLCNPNCRHNPLGVARRSLEEVLDLDLYNDLLMPPDQFERAYPFPDIFYEDDEEQGVETFDVIPVSPDSDDEEPPARGAAGTGHPRPAPTAAAQHNASAADEAQPDHSAVTPTLSGSGNTLAPGLLRLLLDIARATRIPDGARARDAISRKLYQAPGLDAEQRQQIADALLA